MRELCDIKESDPFRARLQSWQASVMSRTSGRPEPLTRLSPPRTTQSCPGRKRRLTWSWIFHTLTYSQYWQERAVKCCWYRRGSVTVHWDIWKGSKKYGKPLRSSRRDFRGAARCYLLLSKNFSTKIKAKELDLILWMTITFSLEADSIPRCPKEALQYSAKRTAAAETSCCK